MAYEAQFQNNDTVEVPPAEIAQPETMPSVPAESSVALLEPVTLPSSVRPPLTTISLPRGVKPIEHEPAGPQLEEIELPSRLRTLD